MLEASLEEMKDDVPFLAFLAVMAFLFAVAGVLALVGCCNAQVIFWNRAPIESETGKVIWIVVSATCSVWFSTLALRALRRRRDEQPRGPDGDSNAGP